jgi:hypothetical protein
MSHTHYCVRDGIHDHRWRCLLNPCRLHEVTNCQDPTSCRTGPHWHCEDLECQCNCHEDAVVSREIRDDCRLEDNPFQP